MHKPPAQKLFDLPAPPARAYTDEWLTPRHVIDALGGAESFDLDPCAPAAQPWPTARATYTAAENGLLRPWRGRVWLNPPYSRRLLRAFLARLSDHGRGCALVPAATETETFWDFVWEAASALLFLRGRLTFHQPDGSVPLRRKERTPQTFGAPSVLCAYGAPDADVLAFCGLPGKFVALRIPRGVLIFAASLEGGKSNTTWREAITAALAGRGPVHLDDLYRAMATHPKTRQNRNWQAKIRQQLQQGPFERVGRGKWRATA